MVGQRPGGVLRVEGVGEGPPSAAPGALHREPADVAVRQRPSTGHAAVQAELRGRYIRGICPAVMTGDAGDEVRMLSSPGMSCRGLGGGQYLADLHPSPDCLIVPERPDRVLGERLQATRDVGPAGVTELAVLHLDVPEPAEEDEYITGGHMLVGEMLLGRVCLG